MSRIAYVNGCYVPHARAAVHIEDRGYQFADGVYEVVGVVDGRLIDETLHLDRLDRSLAEVSIQAPMSRAPLRFIIGEIIRRNQLRHGIVYIQITRGVAPRDHVFPVHAKPAVVMTARRLKLPDPKVVARGVDVITLPDLRWKRCDIKSVSLLPNVLAKQAAKKKGAYEAWLVDEAGLITEGTSTNAGIVTKKGVLVTRAADVAILNGVTRRAVLDLARREGIKIEERCFTLKEALAAREAFITSTTNYVMPVVHIDGRPVGDGKPGAFSRKLRDQYLAHMAKAADDAPLAVVGGKPARPGRR
jgi:D-alanine transaminase